MKYYSGKDSIENPYHCFSNGTESMIWYGNNCDRCVKAWFPKDGEWPKEKTTQSYVACGKYCKLQYWLDIGFIEGVIPDEIAAQIGKGEEYGLKQTCMFFSDNDNDKYKHPKRPKPEPPNQLCMPLNDLFQEVEVKKELQLV